MLAIFFVVEFLKTVSPPVHEKKKKVVLLCSHPRQNVKLGTSTLYSCRDGKEIYKKKDDALAKLFCQSKPIAFSPALLPSPSLLKFPNLGRQVPVIVVW